MGETTRGQLVAYGAAAVVIAIAAWLLLGGGGGEGADRPAAGAIALDGPGAAAGGGAGGRRRGRIYVHVAGAVRRPGLYGVPEGARVAVAVRRAGGPTRRADPVGLNLALRLRDGQQVVIPARGQVVAGAAVAPGAAGAGAAGAAGGGGPQQPIQLSTATVQQLDQLDGIGPTLAQRIIEYRERHGGFRSVEELRQVDGIGEKRFAALRKAVRP
jgi:competence protein ComEA